MADSQKRRASKLCVKNQGASSQSIRTSQKTRVPIERIDDIPEQVPKMHRFTQLLLIEESDVPFGTSQDFF
jgi:hypothetical protein